MQKIVVLIMIALLTLCTAVFAGNPAAAASSSKGGIVYGSDVGVSVTAPAGWVFDSQSGISQGLRGVLYPKGSTWLDSKQMMYVNIVKMAPGKKLGEFIMADIQDFAKNTPGLNVAKQKSLTLKGGIKAEVWQFSSDNGGSFEESAYAQKDTSVIVYVLSSKTKEEYEKSRAAFAEMVTRSSVVKPLAK